MGQIIPFLKLNFLDIHRFLKLSYGQELIPLLQLVFTYNLVTWTLYTLIARRDYRTTIFTTPSRLFSIHHLPAEFKSLLYPLYHKDAHSLALRRDYRIYLGFLYILLILTVLVYLPFTWINTLGIVFGNHLAYHQ